MCYGATTLMPRFYFHVDDDVTSLDEQGTVLPDIEAARQEAITAAGEMLRSGSGKVVWGGKPWRMWVTHEPSGTGKPLLTLRFSASES
jgi:Domain of unknown function (DUF6894)